MTTPVDSTLAGDAEVVAIALRQDQQRTNDQASCRSDKTQAHVLATHSDRVPSPSGPLVSADLAGEFAANRRHLATDIDMTTGSA